MTVQSFTKILNKLSGIKGAAMHWSTTDEKFTPLFLNNYKTPMLSMLLQEKY